MRGKYTKKDVSPPMKSSAAGKGGNGGYEHRSKMTDTPRGGKVTMSDTARTATGKPLPVKS